MTFLASIFVLLRCLGNWKTSIQIDDWICLLSLVVAFGFVICNILLVTIGKAGHHANEYDMQTIQDFTTTYIALDIMAVGSLCLTRVSILFFYRRLFSIKRVLRVATWIGCGLQFAYFVSTSCGIIFASRPVHAEWQPWLPHTHINYKAFWISFSCIGMAFDLLVLALPQPFIWNLKLPRRRKLQVSFIFMLGVLVCFTSVYRLYVVATLDMDDLTYSLMPVVVWNAIEMTTGIICACLPMMPKLFRQLLGRDKNPGSETTHASTPTSSLQKWSWYKKLGKSGFSSADIQLIEHSGSRSSSF
ncbi:hypothetical protein BJX76DRAFT_356054 [Aspergillus varians]